MRIVHINTNDISGGAARAIYRIHQGLLALGEDSSLLVRYRLSTDPTVVQFVPEHGLAARLRRRRRRGLISRDARRYLDNRPQGFELFSDDRCVLGSEVVRSLGRPDIVSLNWIAGFVDFERFFRGLSQAVQVVWRLPDMYPFTGGCHCDAACGRYAESCGSCPQLASRGARDMSRQSWLRKRQAYESLTDGRLQLVALSSSQADEIRRSSLLHRFPVTVIPCGVDVRTFFPRPRAAARECLGLPADRPIVLMVAQSFDRSNKGAALLSASLGTMGVVRKPMLLTVGHGNPHFVEQVEHRHWGPVGDDHLLAQFYSAADLLAFPSLQEGFGQTIVEALACGLPVVGFDSGGMRDAIQPGITGYIAGAKTADALGDVLRVALEDVDQLRGMSRACRETAEARFSVEVVARRYRELCHAVVAR